MITGQMPHEVVNQSAYSEFLPFAFRGFFYRVLSASAVFE